MVQKSIFCHKFHRVPPSILPKFISTDPQHLGSAEQKSGGGAKIHFFTEKMDFSLVRYRNSSARTHNIWGRTKKIRKNPFFYRKISGLHHFLQKFISTDPQNLGSDEKIRKNPFFYRKNFGSTRLVTEIRQTAKTPQKRQLLPLYL